MKAMANIEKSGLRKGEYVGYCNGANRIRREGKFWRMNYVSCKSGNMMTVYGLLRELQVVCEQFNGK